MLKLDCAIGLVLSLKMYEKYPNSTPYDRVFPSILVAQSFGLMALVVPYYGTGSTYEGY